MGEKRSGAGHTRLCKLEPKITAAAVARAGYEGMKRGSTVMSPGLWNKLIALAGELPPRRIALEVNRWLLWGALATRVALLEGPITRTLFELAWPVLAVLALQTFVGVAQTHFVSFLGTGAIAGVALVLPLFMLMTMMSNGGIGGGVSSAVARALGAGRGADAQALVLHAVVIAVAFGAVFTIGAWAGGPALFRYMGAPAETLINGQLYSTVLFAAAIRGWIGNLLGSALRGAGNVRVPATTTAISAVATLGLSPLLIFGCSFVPGLGVAVASAALILFNVAATTCLAVYIHSNRSPLRLRALRMEWRLFRDILKVGLLSAVGTIVANLTVVLATGLVAGFGRDAIAGYGLASRLDHFLIPLLFALGTASGTMVGTNIGAGRRARAQGRMDRRCHLGCDHRSDWPRRRALPRGLAPHVLTRGGGGSNRKR